MKKLSVVSSKQFRRDLKLLAKRQYNFDNLRYVVNQLDEGKPLDIKYHDHNLRGEFSGFRECHIEPDWLLVYRIEDDELILLLMRTGTHADLF